MNGFYLAGGVFFLIVSAFNWGILGMHSHRGEEGAGRAWLGTSSFSLGMFLMLYGSPWDGALVAISILIFLGIGICSGLAGMFSLWRSGRQDPWEGM